MSRTRYFWWVQYLSDLQDWDFLWEPPPWQRNQRHAWPSQWQRDSGVYLIPKSGFQETNYHTDRVVTTLPDTTHWYLPDYIDRDQLDFSWHPDPADPAYIYHFDTQHHWNHVGGPEYRVPGATEVKYTSELVAATKSRWENWYIPDWIDPSSVDPTWVPNPEDPPYVYEFPVEWGWNRIGGPEYRASGATERKYVDAFVSRTRPDPSKFIVSDHISDADDVLRWRPNPAEPPYIYVFGNQHWPAERRESARYVVPGATDIKYVNEIRAQRLPNDDHWNMLIESNIDKSWEPDPGDPPYIYVFGNQHWPAEIMPTVEYHVPGAVERKFMESPVAILPRSDQHWQMIEECEWDSSWQPDPGDPPYIYVFGNQWHPAEIMPTVEYHVPGATERKFMDVSLAKLLPDESRWTVPEEVNRDNVDFSWQPDPGSPPYIYHFGTEYQSSINLTYTVPGATEIKFAGDIPRIQKEKSAVQVMDIFYMDRSNAMSRQRFERLQERYPHIQKVRYVNSVLDTIRRCVNKTKQNSFWVIGSENNYEEFDFAWHPQPWQRSMTHVFGSQWNKWNDTFLINRWEFERNARWAKNIEEFPNLNFVQDQCVHAPADAVDIYVIDHGNRNWQYLTDRYRVVRSARYFDNYLDTLRRLIADVESEHIWVTSSLCDYSRFDFSWQPEAWQRDMLHVFPSNEQKFGDTFYVPTKALKSQIDKLELLDWFETVNYCDDQTVPRWPIPVIEHSQDSHVEVLKKSEFAGPLVVITTQSRDLKSLPTVSLWRDETKTIVPLDPAGSTVIVPKNSISYIKNQLYDYPYIDKTRKSTFSCEPLDIVFISNGEPNAEHNWNWLKETCQAKMHGNRIIRINGVNGRAAAYKAALEAANTDWAFCVFAKLQIEPTFDWSWQPDRMQSPKHYIFHARNPVNGLVYGHMAMIAYNKRLTLENEALGLDFTLDQAHEVVPVLSGVAWYADSPWMAWRTAFREVLKLRHSLPDVENEYRLNRWLVRGEGRHGGWSILGAQDAVEYYEEVDGDFAALKKSYEWSWLASYAMLKRNLLPDQ